MQKKRWGGRKSKHIIRRTAVQKKKKKKERERKKRKKNLKIIPVKGNVCNPHTHIYAQNAMHIIRVCLYIAPECVCIGT